MSLNQYSLVSLQDSVESLIGDGELDTPLELVQAFVERIINDSRSVGRVFDAPLLDALCLRLGEKALLQMNLATKTPVKGRVVFVATEFYRHGGHTLVATDFVRLMPEHEHVFLMTDVLANPDHDAFDLRLKPLGASVEVAPTSSKLERLRWLLSRLSELAPEKIYWFNHPQDPVAVAAAQAALPGEKYFIHHADHQLCLGLHARHLRHVDLHNIGFFNCREVLGIADNIYWPLVCDDFGQRSMEHRFVKSGKLRTCSAGSGNKFEIPYLHDYADVMARVLHATGGDHVHIGDLSEKYLERLRGRLAEEKVPQKRFVQIPWVPSLWRALIEREVDVYLASWPIGGGKALIEALGAGIPSIVHVNYISRFHSGFDLNHPAAPTWRTPAELVDQLAALTPDTLASQSRAARVHYEMHHAPKLLASLLDGDCQNAPKPIPLREYRPDTLQAFLDERAQTNEALASEQRLRLEQEKNIAAQERNIEALRIVLKGREAELAAQGGHIEAVRAEITSKNRELADLQRQHSTLQAAHASLQSNLSWRISHPYRAMGQYIRFRGTILLNGLLQRVARKARILEEVTPQGSLIGCLDVPQPDIDVVQGPITVAGWLFSTNIPIKQISVEVDAPSEFVLTYGFSRPDVFQVYPNYLAAQTSGFTGVCFVEPKNHGTRIMTLWATLENGERERCFTRQIKTTVSSGPRTLRFSKFPFLWNCAKKAWHVFNEGRLPLDPIKWIRSIHRDYRLALANSLYVEFQNVTGRLPQAEGPPYARWIEKNRLTSKLLSRMRADAERLAPGGPTISIVVPVFNTPRRFLEELVDSVIAQVYPKWELCLADDGSTQPHVKEVLERAAADDNRVKIVFRKENGHIVEATNSALGIATGSYVAFLDHDDLLPPDAMLHVAECISRNPHVDWIYTDEDKINSKGKRFDPQFKGVWNPEMAITHNFTHHLTVIRRDLVNQVGGMRKGFEGAQDLDLFLRVAEHTTPDRIKHVPRICYHWRAHEGSTASNGGQKRYVFDSAFSAIVDATKRRGLDAEPFLPPIAERHAMCLYQLKWHAALTADRKVTIVIPTRDRADLLRRCISSLDKTLDHRFVRLLIVDDRSSEPTTLDYLRELELDRILDCRVIRPENPDGKFNYARLLNEAARHVDTPFILHLNNDVEALEPGWLEEMMGWLSIEGVGVVGARLLYPDGNIQHGGVVVGPHGGLADHQFHLLPREEVGYLAMPHAARNVSAVTGACLLTSINLYREIGGFDEENFAVAYNDVDFCLRVIAAGKRIVYTPQATLLHLTGASRGIDYIPAEHINFLQRYNKFRDPFFNENVQIDSMWMSVDPHHFVHADRVGRLNVLLITHNLNLGGAPIVAYEFAKYFVENGGYQVTLISPEDGPVKELYDALNVPVHILRDFPPLHMTGASTLRAYLKKLGAALRIESFDLVVCNTLTTFWGVELANLYGVPSTWHIHESTPLDVYGALLGRSTLPLLWSGFANARRVVFQAEATRAIFQRLDVGGNFRTIPGGVPMDRINAFRAAHEKKQLRAKYGLDEDCTVVTLIGTICERKGQHVFLEAIKELEKKYSNGLPNNLVFMMVGAIKGPYLTNLQKRREQLGLGNVRIWDESKEIYDFFALSDIFVCASFEESFPMVVLLAMAFGLKIVSTDVFGIPEIISDGYDGRLVKPGDPVALSAAIYTCLNDLAGSERMASNAHAKVCRMFDNQKLLEQHLLLSKEVWVEEDSEARSLSVDSEYRPRRFLSVAS